jgi:flagellar FliL protein
MSDEQQDLNLEDVGAGAEDVSGPRRGGLFSGLVLNILKWAAIGVGVIILVVTTTVVTFNIIKKGSSSQGLAAVSPAYQAKSGPLASYDNIDTIRGQTADETPAVFLLRISLLYETADKQVSVEMGLRNREIQDLVLKYISKKTAAELGPGHYDEIQGELQQQLNMIMTTGKVKRVVFREFTVVK